MEAKINIGLIGLGKMGKNHLRVLSSIRNIDKIYIYDTNSKITSNLGKDNFIIPLKNLKDMKNYVDTIIISSPTTTHYELINIFIRHVKNIFVEKPICENSIQAKKILELCKKFKKNIFVGFIERFNPVIPPLKRVFEQPSINVDFFRTDKVSSRITDVDVVADLMIHDIDLAIYLNGNVLSCSGYGKLEDNQVVFACANLAHENGSYSRLMASKITEKKMRCINITFEDKFINCDLLDRNLQINKQSLSVPKTHDEFAIESSSERVHVLPIEPLLSQTKAFVENSENSILATQYDAYKAQQICDKIRNDIILKSATHSSLSSISFLQKEIKYYSSSIDRQLEYGN